MLRSPSLRCAISFLIGKLALSTAKTVQPAVAVQDFAQWPQSFPVVRSPLAQRNVLPRAFAMPLSAAPTVACRIATEQNARPVLHAAAAGGSPSRQPTQVPPHTDNVEISGLPAYTGVDRFDIFNLGRIPI